MDECKYLLTFIASNKNNKNTSVIQFFIFTIAHNIASDIICKMEYNKVILTIAYKNKKKVFRILKTFSENICFLNIICIFATEFISHLREGNRRTQALMLCVFCFL